MYRAGQFFRALGARMSPAALAEVGAWLSPEQVALFWRMPPYDQRHGLSVMRTLLAAGHRQPDLLTAALLHDVAKSAGPLRLWQRVTIVLLKAFAPRWLAWLSREAAANHWRYAFYLHRVHPEVGARWAQDAGCSTLAVWLIARHQSPADLGEGEGESEKHRLLSVLRWADNQN